MRRAPLVAVALVCSGFGFHDGPSLPVPVQFHNVLGLPDGRVLITGGVDGPGNSRAEAWLYEPWSGRLTAAAPMALPHLFHVGVVLRDGRALIIAGKLDGATQNMLTEIYDPRLDSWADAGLLHGTHERGTATLLLDGRVLLAGDYNEGPNVTAEIFADGGWAVATPMPPGAGRGETASVRLGDGRVLFIAGEHNFAANTADILTTTLLFDPGTGVWAPGPSLNDARRDLSAIRLTDGGVFISGGRLSDAALFNVLITESLLPTGWLAGGSLPSGRWSQSLWVLPDETIAMVSGTSAVEDIDLRDPTSGALTMSPLSQSNPRVETQGVPTVDGRLVLAGGDDQNFAPTGPITNLELRSLTVQTLPSLPTARERQSATLLPDGRVLVVGGTGSEQSMVVWLPDAGFVDGGQLLAPRADHRAALMPSGEVLIVGGDLSPQTAELCVPGGCRAAAPLFAPAQRAAAVQLHDGRVLVMGGSVDQLTQQVDLQTYDPATDSWADAGQMLLGRQQHRAVVLDDGRVLITAGDSSVGDPRLTEVWNPATGLSVDAGFSSSFHDDAVLVLLPDGRVLLAGGDLPDGGSNPATELWTAASGWVDGGALPQGANGMAAVVARDDRLWTTGGLNGATALTDFDHFEVPGDVFEGESPLAVARYFHTMTLLPDGELLIVGGLLPTQAVLRDVEIAQLGPPVSPRLQPTLDAVSAPLVIGTTHAFTGAQLTGNGEASSGSWRSSPSETPTFRFEAWDAKSVHHVGPSSWDANVANVGVTAALAPGWYEVTAIVAGISSRAVAVRLVLPTGSACRTGSSCEGGACTGGLCDAAMPGSDAGVDAGTDGGTRDAGPTPGVRNLRVGCGCSNGPLGALCVLALLMLRGAKKRRHGSIELT